MARQVDPISDDAPDAATVPQGSLTAAWYRAMSGKARTQSVLLAKRLSDNKKLNVGQVHGTANR